MIKKPESPHAERARIKPPEIRPRPSRPAQNPHPTHPARPSRPGGGRKSGNNRMPADRPGSVKQHTANKLGPRRENQSVGNVKPNNEAVRFVPLGGLEEVGRNCMFL